MSIAIAIDGPAGAGKSTIARLAAKELGYIYVDTGALYRTIGLAAFRRDLTADDKEQIIAMLPEIKVELAFNERQEQIVLLDGEDVSGLIRTPEISMMASAVSAIPEVRAYLLDLQRDMAHTNNVIMDGRDIGTVVLPDAKIKIFLSASPECRARRRYDELIEKGMDIKYEDILSDVIARDYADSHRDIAPLMPADDAITVDTSGEDLETSVNKLLGIMRDKL
ncbi:(d)CMP kinase [Ruminococcus sp.]|uniref:(d)CMP kinase n=1 Tax=Ruminococcus sp. TaxID=41978 RepID=UPI00386ED8E6